MKFRTCFILKLGLKRLVRYEQSGWSAAAAPRDGTDSVVSSECVLLYILRFYLCHYIRRNHTEVDGRFNV